MEGEESHAIVCRPGCLHGPQVINAIVKKCEFSFLIRYYNLLYQSLIPNCKLTIKILKQHLEIPTDVEGFIVNGESSRVRCQRIINLLLVQLDTTKDYKQFCYLFNMISVMTNLPDKLGQEFKCKGKPTPSVDCQVDSYATVSYAMDNVVIKFSDDGPSEDRADNYSISSHIFGRRRCRTERVAICCNNNTEDISSSSTPSVNPSLTVSPTGLVVTSAQLNITTNSIQPAAITSSCSTSRVDVDTELLTTNNQVVTINQVTEQESLLTKGLHLVKSKCDAIVQSLPDDYGRTVEAVQEDLTDAQICDVLGSTNHVIANKTILNCLIEKVKCMVDILAFCNQLEKIAPLLPKLGAFDQIISDLRSYVNDSFYQLTFSQITLPPNSKVLAILKKNYSKICHCLPRDYVKTVEELNHFISGIPANYLHCLSSLPSTDVINEEIAGQIMSIIKEDHDVLEFCDILHYLCDDITSKRYIATLKKEFLNVLQSPPSIQDATNTTPSNIGGTRSNLSSTLHQPSLPQHLSDDSSGSMPVVSSAESYQPMQTGNLSSKIELQEQLQNQQVRQRKVASD